MFSDPPEALLATGTDDAAADASRGAQQQAQQPDRETGRVAATRATRATQATLSENTHPLVATSYRLRT